jgi:hypothetical protein
MFYWKQTYLLTDARFVEQYEVETECSLRDLRDLGKVII